MLADKEHADGENHPVVHEFGRAAEVVAHSVLCSPLSDLADNAGRIYSLQSESHICPAELRKFPRPGLKLSLVKER